MNKQAHIIRPIIRTMPWDGAKMSREVLLTREWLVTNGLGGYASGTVSGAITRRYHGLLIAALPAPFGRMVMWNHVSEFLRFSDHDVVSLGGEERAGGQLDLKVARVSFGRWPAGLDVSRARCRSGKTRSSAPFAKHRARYLPHFGMREMSASGAAPGFPIPPSRNAGE